MTREHLPTRKTKKMKKTTKSILGVAAIATLFAGTAGTFALWYDTAALGAETDAVSTGDLRLTDESLGEWVWSHVSHETDGITVDVTPLDSENDLLVPGDAVKFLWSEDAADITLAGTTLVAELYLDGVDGEDGLQQRLTEPLIVMVDGEQVDATTSFLITVADGVATLPEIIVGFPVDRDDEGELRYNLPEAELNGYGRNIVDADAISLYGLQLRLQQVTNGNNIFDPFAPTP